MLATTSQVQAVPARRRWRLRVSLRSLLCVTLLLGSGFSLRQNWDPWRLSRVVHYGDNFEDLGGVEQAIAIIQEKSTARLVDLDGGVSYPLPSSAKSEVWTVSPDGSRLAIVFADRTFAILDRQARALHQAPLPMQPSPRQQPQVQGTTTIFDGSSAVTMRFSGDSRRLLMISRDNEAAVLDLASYTFRRQGKLAKGFAYMNHDGSSIVLDTVDQIRVYDTQTFALQRVLVDAAPNSAVIDLFRSKTGAECVLLSDIKSLAAYEIASGKLLYELALPNEVGANVVTASGSILVATDDDRGLLAVDIAAGRLLYRTQMDFQPVFMRAAPDGGRVHLWRSPDFLSKPIVPGNTINFGGPVIFDGRSGARLTEAPSGPSPNMAFSSDGRTAYDFGAPLPADGSKPWAVGVWTKTRDETPLAVLTLLEFWSTALLLIATVWSAARDWRTFRQAA